MYRHTLPTQADRPSAETFSPRLKGQWPGGFNLLVFVSPLNFSLWEDAENIWYQIYFSEKSAPLAKSLVQKFSGR